MSGRGGVGQVRGGTSRARQGRTMRASPTTDLVIVANGYIPAGGSTNPGLLAGLLETRAPEHGRDSRPRVRVSPSMPQ